ncbi:hypothetical protein GO495_06590 [Chitinophaga oryziterrae]|uniref:Uncharacterized protein n=1 Tax=Chitinophaga oryziterrae TaxID=1031224 RepID=A0A6N8J7S2_9BACT|nr:hypothetical protein [Chitinophaga oryziterrae]MVT40242.1 hypothetical protein [Chitinophaga oryziterrae]
MKKFSKHTDHTFQGKEQDFWEELIMRTEDNLQVIDPLKSLECLYEMRNTEGTVFDKINTLLKTDKFVFNQIAIENLQKHFEASLFKDEKFTEPFNQFIKNFLRTQQNKLNKQAKRKPGVKESPFQTLSYKEQIELVEKELEKDMYLYTVTFTDKNKVLSIYNEPSDYDFIFIDLYNYLQKLYYFHTHDIAVTYHKEYYFHTTILDEDLALKLSGTNIRSVPKFSKDLDRVTKFTGHKEIFEIMNDMLTNMQNHTVDHSWTKSHFDEIGSFATRFPFVNKAVNSTFAYEYRSKLTDELYKMVEYIESWFTDPILASTPTITLIEIP